MRYLKLLLTAPWLACATLISSSAVAQGDDGLIVSHGYSFFGDLRYDADFRHLDYVNPNAPKGGEISVAGLAPFNSFNIYTRKGHFSGLAYGLSVGNATNQNIMTSLADDITSLYCLLCETLQYPKDLSWLIFNLRPEVAFSDGRPMTAHDIEYSFNKFMTEGLPSFRAAFGSFIEKIEVLDDHTIKYTFSPDSPIRDRVSIAATIGPLHKDWFEDNDVVIDQIWETPPPSTGPYVYESHDPNREVVFRRNPDYWGKDLPISQGRHNFDTIREVFFADRQVAFEGFKAGEYTFRSENTSRLWGTAYEPDQFKNLKDGYVIKTELPDGTKAPGQSFVFNLRRDKFQDIRVREAIGLMFNFEWSNDALFYGLYERINGFWDNSYLAATGVPSEAERAILTPLVTDGLLDASILTDAAVMAPPSGARQLDRRNLRKASALLDAAGWITGDDGLRRKDGQVLQVGILESSPAFDRIILPYVKNLQALGVDAELTKVDPAQKTDRKRAYDFDMTTHSINLPYEPSTGLKQWFHTGAMEGSSRNLMGLSDPAIDRLVEIVIAAGTAQDLEHSVKALDRVLRAKKFWVPQWFKDVHTVAYYDQFGYPEVLPPYALGTLDFWWFDAQKAMRIEDAGVLN